MSDEAKPPERPNRARVISLVDRLSPARRAVITLREHIHDKDQEKRVERLAKRLAELNPNLLFADLKRIGTVIPEAVEAAALIQSLIAAERLLDGDADGAFADWERILVEFPKSRVDVLTIRCTFRIVRHELDLALADMTRAVELEPTNARLYARRGDVLRRLDRDDEAMANFRRAVQLDHDNVLALGGLGLCLVLAGAPAEALPFYTRAVRHAPRVVELRLGRSMCFEELGRREEAIADVDAALKNAPKDAEAHYARGRLRPDTERAEAIADFTRSIALDDEDAEVWAARAHANQMIDVLDAAVSDANQSLALQPDNPTALFTRAIARIRLGEYDAARADYDALVRAVPNEPLFADARDKALELMARLEERKKKE